MKTFPLQSLTLAQAQQKQFALVDTLCRHFPGADFLAGGDFGVWKRCWPRRFMLKPPCWFRVLAPGLFAPGWPHCSNPGSGCWYTTHLCILQHR